MKINDTCIGIFGGIQPEILHTFARGKIQNGFVDRWLFAFPEKVPYPKFDDVDIDKKIAKNWSKIIDTILKLPFNGTPKIVKLSPGAKRLYKEWYNKLSEQKNHSGSAFAGLATKMDRYCARFALGLEVLKYGCGESEMKNVSEESMRGAIALISYHPFYGTSGTIDTLHAAPQQQNANNDKSATRVNNNTNRHNTQTNRG